MNLKCIQVQKARLKTLYKVWFCWCDILQKADLWDGEESSSYKELELEEGGYKSDT